MTVLYIVLAIVILLFMVLIHEFGHYVVGKLLGFKITEFSIGFGFALFSHTSKKTGEKFSLRAFPLGGYCSFYGEEEDGTAAFSDKKVWSKEFRKVFGKENVAFNDQPPWKRILVFLAGVAANFLTAIIFSWILLCTMGYDIPQISAVSTEYSNPFEVGDVITHIDGQKIDFAFGETYNTLISEEYSNAKTFYLEKYGLTDYDSLGEIEYYTFDMTVTRDGENLNLTITVYPVISSSTNQSGETEYSLSTVMGISTKAYVYGAWEGFCRSFEMAFGFAWVVLKALWQIVTFNFASVAEFAENVGGTVSTIATLANYMSQSMSYLLILIPLIAANLAVFNVLPFPALDGSHVLFTVIEWIRGKPINRNVENMIHFGGMCLLLGFVVIVDILHFVL